MDVSTPARPRTTEPDWRQIEGETPGLSIASVRRIGEGWMSVAYLVNDDLVIKAPKSRETWDDLRPEAEFLDYARSLLPLAIPRCIALRPESSAGAFGYAVYEYVRGEQLDVESCTLRERDAAASTIAGFMRSLHGLTLPADLAARIPHEDPRVAEQYLANAKRHIVPRLSAQQGRTLIERIDAYLGDPGNRPLTETVLHADLSPDHIIVRDGAVSGVIDFGDVCRGDPDYDFVYLFADVGPGFVEEVGRRYDHPDLDRLMRAVEHYALLDRIDTIVHGPGRALDGQIEGSWALLRAILEQENRR